MPDFGVTSLVGIIDGVKVLAFAVRQGRVAVHCHAGLGRTGTSQHTASALLVCSFLCSVLLFLCSGVLIACYLIYTLRISASEAVHYVRIKRPRSIQTRAQISQVFDFARLLGTQLVQYPDLSLRHGAPFTLQHYINRQALLLHGQEGRTLRHTPKVRTEPPHHTWTYCRTSDLFLFTDLLSSGGVPSVCPSVLPGPGPSCSSRGPR